MSWDWSADERAALARFLADRGLTHGPVTTRAIGDGHSNLTYLVGDGECQVVVRRPPPPPVPKGAHDVLREAKLIDALRGTGVAVPEVLGTAQAGDVLDVPFFVMSHVAGPVVTTRTPEALADPQQRRAIGESLIDTLAALHAVDWRAHGLEGFGKPDGFNARHLARMAALVAGPDDAAPPGFEAIDEWLRENVPPEAGATIVHNDFRLGNMILAPGPPGRVAAVLDWELATIGDPLLDVAYLLASWPVEGEDRTPTNEFATAVLEPGYPTRAELADRYVSRTGRSLDNLQWYTALVQWKLAVLYEYGRRRAVEGRGDDYYADPAHVRAFLAAAHRAAGIPAG